MTRAKAPGNVPFSAGDASDPRRAFVAEPPAIYRVHPPLVVDCSLIAALLFQEQERDEALARLHGRSLHAPALLDFEIISVTLKKLKRGEGMTVAEGIAHYQWFAVERHEVDVAETLALAHRYSITGYDAAYLWLAADLRAPLATFDRRLAHAAKAHLESLE